MPYVDDCEVELLFDAMAGAITSRNDGMEHARMFDGIEGQLECWNKERPRFTIVRSRPLVSRFLIDPFTSSSVEKGSVVRWEDDWEELSLRIR